MLLGMKSILDKTEWSYNPAWSLADDKEAAIWKDCRLSLKAKGVWSYMRAKPSNWDFCAKRIANDCKDERKSIQRAMKELEEFGYLSRKKMGNGRVRCKLGADPYVGVEPEIARSPFDGFEVNMEVGESLYDHMKDYRGAEGRVQTIGEAYEAREEIDFISINDCIDELVEGGMKEALAKKTGWQFWQSCDEANVVQNRFTWGKWKLSYVEQMDAMGNDSEPLSDEEFFPEGYVG